MRRIRLRSSAVRDAAAARRCSPGERRAGAAASASISTTGPTTSTPAVLKDFTRETGIKVSTTRSTPTRSLETKLLAGKSGYDVVVPTAYFLQRQIKAGVFQQARQVEAAEPRATRGRRSPSGSPRYDPGNQYAVNYMWGTTGIGYNVKKAREHPRAPTARIDSWDIVFKPENLAKFKDCGVHMLDSADDIFPAALSYLGLNPNSKEQADLREGRRPRHQGAAVGAQVPLVGISQRARRPAKSASWSAGRATSSRRRSAPRRPRTASRSATPSRRRARRCGSTIWRSRRTRKNVADAYALIDYLLRPEVAAQNSEFRLLRQRQSREPEVHRARRSSRTRPSIRMPRR